MAAYNKRSVDKAIKRSPKKISGKEAKLIHGLLKGRGPVSKPSKALTERYKKSQKKARAAFNEFQKASENKGKQGSPERKRFIKAARAERAATKRYIAANDAYAKALRGEK
tara:strand:+ start:9586 stop:9918 length:333 start_codon:yes stop_codon:yes gene_type:complete